jgi:hypothetical protein
MVSQFLVVMDKGETELVVLGPGIFWSCSRGVCQHRGHLELELQVNMAKIAAVGLSNLSFPGTHPRQTGSLRDICFSPEMTKDYISNEVMIFP